MAYELINELSIDRDYLVTRADRVPEIPLEVSKKSTGIIHTVVSVDKVPVFNMADGACYGLDADIFYPEKPELELKEKTAKEICGMCKVENACLEDALAKREEYGIRGGATERERRNILRRKARLEKAEAKIA